MAALRYTQADNSFNGCSADSGDGMAASDFGAFQNFVRGPGSALPANPPIPLGGCITADDTLSPGLVHEKLNENNVSWRAGAEWTRSQQTLLYANVSKGYKAGGFPDLGATTATQYTPATQEKRSWPMRSGSRRPCSIAPCSSTAPFLLRLPGQADPGDVSIPCSAAAEAGQCAQVQRSKGPSFRWRGRPRGVYLSVSGLLHQLPSAG